MKTPHPNESKNFRPGILGLLATFMLATTLPALAQDDDETSNEEQDTLEELIVYGSYTTRELDTGTGLGLGLHETPQSVSVLTFQRLEDQNLRSLTDVVQNIAGISAKETDSSRYRFAARGFDIERYQIDGVPVEWQQGWSAGETQIDTLLYERIEVVRGATGLLSGAGNPSASINLVRKHADSRELRGTASLLAGKWNTWGANVDVGTPLNGDGSVRGRFIASYQEGDSFMERHSNEKTVGYAVVDADLGDNTTLSVGASYQDNDPSGSTWGALPAWYTDGTRTSWDRSKSTSADWTSWASTNETYFANLTTYFADDWQARLYLNRTESVGDLRLLYVFGQVDPDTGMGLGGSPRRYDSIREQDDVAVKINGSFDWMGRDHELLFGITHSNQDHGAYGYTRSEPVDSMGSFYDYDGDFEQPTWSNRAPSTVTTTKQTGFYGATRLKLTESLKFILGGRSADWERTGEDGSGVVDYGDTEFVPYSGVLYDINDQHTVYASYTEIFYPQDEQDRNGAYLPPLVGQSYEAGLKSKFFDERLYTTVTLFQLNQDNLAQPDTGFTVPPENIAQAYRPAQGTESEGYEIEVVGTLFENWDVSFSWTDFDAVEGTESAGEVNPSQDVNTHQPRNLLRLFSTYEFSDRLEGLTVGGGINWESETYTDVINPITGEPARLTQDAFTLVNLMARYDFERYSVQLNVENLTDENYYSQIGFYGGYWYGRPRNATLNLRYFF